MDGAYVNVTGDGTFGVAGPLTLSDGGWVESDVDTTWTGSAPWQLGGGTGPAGPPPLGLRDGRRAAHDRGRDRGAARPAAGDGVIQLDGGATLSSRTRRRRRSASACSLDTAEVHVLAGKLIGELPGQRRARRLSRARRSASRARALQLAPPAIDARRRHDRGRARLRTSRSALPAHPALRRSASARAPSLDVNVDDGTGPVETPPAPDASPTRSRSAPGATLSIDGGGGTLALADQRRR